jgi:guanylate kinase
MRHNGELFELNSGRRTLPFLDADGRCRAVVDMSIDIHAKVRSHRGAQLRAAVEAARARVHEIEDELVAFVHRDGVRPIVDAIVMSGPSGVGKGTIIKRLMDERPGVFSFCVSHTSRQPRQGELHGVNYHFSSKDEMEEMSQSGEFLECCQVHGNMYGTSKKALRNVQQSGKVPLIEIDVQGAKKLKAEQSDLKLCFIFVEAPNMSELESRILGRGQEASHQVQARLKTALTEMDFVHNNRAFFDLVLTNVELEDSIRTLSRYFAVRCGV